MLAKRLGYLWTAPLVTAMTFHHQHVTFRLENSFLYHPKLEEHEEGTRFPYLAVNELRAEEWTGDRHVWREKAVHEMFAVQLTPLLKTLVRNCAPFDEYSLGEYYGADRPTIRS